VADDEVDKHTGNAAAEPSGDAIGAQPLQARVLEQRYVTRLGVPGSNPTQPSAYDSQMVHRRRLA
jgi:hypothetical protein